MPHAVRIVVAVGVGPARLGGGPSRYPAALGVVVAHGLAGDPAAVGVIVARLGVGHPDTVRVAMPARLAGQPASVLVVAARGRAGDPAAIIVVAAGDAGDPVAVGVIIAAGRSRHPASAVVVVAAGRGARVGRNPAALAVVIAVRRAIDPVAVAVIVARRVCAVHGVGVPQAVAIIKAVGVRTVGVGLGQLVADDGAADTTNERARGPIVRPCDRATEQCSDAGAGHRPNDPGVALFFASLLGGGQGRNQSDRGDAGDEQMFAHGGGAPGNDRCHFLCVGRTVAYGRGS